MIQRAVLACLAAAAIVVLAVWLRSSHLQAEALSLRPKPGTPASSPAVKHAIGLLERAARNNADTQPRVDEAILLIFTGHKARAAQLLGGVVSEEPSNPAAWGLLAQATSRSNPQVSAAAAARARALAPPVGR